MESTSSDVPPQLLNPLASDTDTTEPPSLQYGVPRDLELDLRAYGSQVIHRLGQLLSLPQRLTATAQILFQRFWYTTSFTQFSCLDVAAAAVFLSSKLEEYPIRLRDLINCFDFILQLHRYKAQTSKAQSPWTRTQVEAAEQRTSQIAKPFTYQPHSYHSDSFYEYKDSLVIHEMQLLKRLGFQTEAMLPYSTLVNYLQVLGFGRDRKVVQECWACCSDMLQTPLPALFPFHVLSVAAIYYHSIQQGHSLNRLPRSPAPWWTLFDARIEELRVVCAWLMRLHDEEHGTASRVRDEWGGLVHLAKKESLRKWLDGRDRGGDETGPNE